MPIRISEDCHGVPSYLLRNMGYALLVFLSASCFNKDTECVKIVQLVVYNKLVDTAVVVTYARGCDSRVGYNPKAGAITTPCDTTQYAISPDEYITHNYKLEWTENGGSCWCCATDSFIVEAYRNGNLYAKYATVPKNDFYGVAFTGGISKAYDTISIF